MIIFITLFLNLILLSSQEKHQGSDSVLDIDYDDKKVFTEYEVENSKQNQRFQVNFGSTSSIRFYMKIELTVTGDYPTPILCFSATDSNCDEREQIVKNPNEKSVVMWLKREQFLGEEKNLYLKVICDKDGAEYTLRLEGDKSAVFEPNFVYSYYIGAYNREMLFEIKGNGKTGTLLAAVQGGKNPSLSMENSQAKTFDKVQVAFIPIMEETNDTLTVLTVKGSNEDYLTLSVQLISDDGVSEILEPNGPEIIGYLENQVLKEDCYKISHFATTYKKANTFYLTGRLNSMFATLYLKDENGKKIDDSTEEIKDGHISTIIKSGGSIKQICIALPDIKDSFYNNFYYTLTLTEPTTLNDLYNYYPPQLPGYIYRRFLPKGKIAFYYPMALDNTKKKYNYNLYSIKGYSTMAITKCTDYPNCHYNSLNDLEMPKNTNQMTIWTTENDMSSAIGKEKNVIVVECRDDDNENNGYCLFETSFINKGDTINLIPNEKLSNYVLKEEKGSFKLNIGEGVNAKRLVVDIMVFSGDVSFNLKDSEKHQLYYHKYFLSNKVLFYFEFTQSGSENYEIEFLAALNSFFTIQYGFDLDNPKQNEEIVPSGENYLVQIDPTSVGRKKTVHLKNLRYKKEKPFLANFFALNCDFEVKRNDKIKEFFDGYAQEILVSTDDDYKKEKYDYEISITEPDLSNYNHKMCMLYVGGIESDDDYQKEMVIGENINQQIIFDSEIGFKKVRFLYPQADYDKDLAIYANVIDPAYYELKIFLNNEKDAIYSYKLTRTQIYYLSKKVIQNVCAENQICSVIIQVELLDEFIKTDPMVEITVRHTKNIPSYIQKGRAKRDFTCGDNLYYLYTDVGKNEEGEVLVDFLRDFGDIWGKIVRKDQTSIDEEANWRGIYRMPSRDWEDSLEYNKYIKKLIIRTEDTSDCIEGCYLLLSIKVSEIGEYVDDSRFYPFSILAKISPNNRAYTDIPKVVIQVDEYIIGNVDISSSERISQFYEVWLPHDSPRVDFDWQSGVAGLYINLGGTRPTTKNSDFKLIPPGKDSILSLSHDEIYNKAKEKGVKIPNKDSIQDLSLVIGVWTDKTSAVDTEIYSLRVHQSPENNNKLDIIEIKADKKIICKPHHLTGDEYRCLFMVTYDLDDNLTPFFGHAYSVDISAMTYMYANFVERKLYDELDDSGLQKLIPTQETAMLNSKSDGVDYIYTRNLDIQSYLFINVITDSPEDIIFLPNMPLYNYISYDMFEFYPTPGKEQLLSVAGEKLRLQFATEKSILVNIVTLSGEAEVWWKSDPSTVYNVRGRGDRLTLSSGKEADHLIIRKRDYYDQFENQNIKKNLQYMENPGFLFYISYYLKEEQNFDEVIYGKSLEFAYRDTDFPVILYSKIGNLTSDLNVAVTIRDLEFDNSGEFSYSPLLVRASLIKENTIYKAKKDPDLAPSIDRLILGSYDIALKTAQVMVPKEIISTYNLKTSDNPSLYLSIEKSYRIQPKIYEKFSIEVQFSKANEGAIPSEKVYHYARLGDQSRMTFYKLRIDRQKPYMRIQIAFNSDYTDFYVAENFGRTNMTFSDERKERGKIMVTLSTEDVKKEFIYLVFYKKDQTHENSLYNYVFKYINAKDLKDFVDYKILESEELVYKENINNEEPSKSTINCTFHKIDIDSSKANITYFFKVVKDSTYLTGEKSDTIAVMESQYYTVYERNPKDNNGLITLYAKGDFRRWTILQVVAQIQQETILEYVTYKGKYIERPKEEDDDNNNNGNQNNSEEEVSTTGFFVVGGILLVLIIGLLVAIIIFKIKNQELVEQVKHVSFQKTNSANYNNNVDSNNLIQNQ